MNSWWGGNRLPSPIVNSAAGRSTENKISGQVCLLCGIKELRANNCHYQEFSTRKENHTSYDQFKSAKLLYLASLLSRAYPQSALKREKSHRKKSPTLQVVRLTRYRTSFPSSIHSERVLLLCCVPFLAIVPVVVVVVGKSAREVKYGTVHGNHYQILKRPVLHHLVIFKDSVTFFTLSTGLLMQG